MTVKDPRHTPGPWRVAYRRAYDEQVGEFGCVVSLVIDDQIVDLGSVGIVGGNYEDFKRAEANARLISVAPELYEALEVLVDEIEWEIGEEKWGRDPDALAKAKRVLAKVRGGAE